MSTSIPVDAKRFRASFVSSGIFCFFSGLVGIPLGFILILFLDGHIDVVKFFRVILVVSPRLLLDVLIATFLLFTFFLFLPVGVSLNGIYAFSFWGFRRSIQWNEITKVKKFRLFNLRWLRIYSTSDGKVVWLPLFLSGNFPDEIRKVVPANNLLLNYFV